MNTVEVKEISKSFAGRSVVQTLSFDIGPGEIMGLIGPNGAGKTTTIRMVMDVIKPDSGSVQVMGQKFSDRLKNQIGYLPEERGLYRKTRIVDTMVYLGKLKGLSPAEAQARSLSWLQRTGMQAHQNKRVEELSHGMGQIIQFLVTILHAPQVIILDEPFTGLDPVNVKLVKDIVLELKGHGTAIILSTHRMNEVEEMCDRVLMIDRGRAVLSGNLREIKAGFRKHSLLIDVNEKLEEIPGATLREVREHLYEIALESSTSPQQVLAGLLSRGFTLNRFEIATPSLNEIFLEVAGGRR